MSNIFAEYINVTKTQTDMQLQTTLRMTAVTTGRIYAMRAIWPK